MFTIISKGFENQLFFNFVGAITSSPKSLVSLAEIRYLSVTFDIDFSIDSLSESLTQTSIANALLPKSALCSSSAILSSSLNTL